MLQYTDREMAGSMKFIHWGLILSLYLLMSLIDIGSSEAEIISQDLQIISPVEGTIIAPGQTITVVVSVAPGSSFTELGVVGDLDIGFSDVKTAPPYEFSLFVQKFEAGKAKLTAVAKTSSGSAVFSQSVTINVETPAVLTAMKTSPKRIFFRRPGGQGSISVTGTFDDGSTLNITRSTRITYTSNDPTVATVSSTGIVTAVGPGPIGIPEISTNIIVSYGNKSVNVPVIIHPIDNVTIDIKPGSHPNSINLGSHGTVPVAILSTADFDATTVDPLSVTLANAHVKLKGKGTPMASSQDVNGDGRLDLVVHVETEALELSPTSKKAILDGKTFSGMVIRGLDSVRVVP